MLPTSVVSFMKKMTQTEQNTLPDALPLPATSNSLCKLKKTLSASLNQVQISAKATLSAKGIGFSEKDVGDIIRKKINKDSAAEKPPELLDADSIEISLPEADASDKVAQSGETQPGLQQRQYDRLASCRVCVRSLSSAGNQVVSFRLCSECNYKICEDCASYSDQDCELEQSFWRCSICRRRSSSPRQISGETTLSLGSSSRRGTFASDSSDSQLLHDSYDGTRHQSEKERTTTFSTKPSAPARTEGSVDHDCSSKPNAVHGEETMRSVSANEPHCSPDKSRSLGVSTSGLYSEHRRRSFRSNRSRNLAEDSEALDTEGGRASSLGLHSSGGLFIAVDDERVRQHRSPSPSHKETTDFSLSPGGAKDRSPMHRRAINQSRSRSASAHEEAQAGSFDADHIRIVVDHVDSAFKECVHNVKKLPYNTTSVRIHREGPCLEDYLFTDSFGLSLAEGDETQVTYIQPNGPAHKAGLECGDVILSWDGIKLAGRSIWDVHEDLKHSGDSIEVVVMKRKFRLPRNVASYETVDNQLPRRPSCLATTSFLSDPSRIEKAALASPTRRRLPRAPLPHSTAGMPSSHHESNDELRILFKVMVYQEEGDLSRVSITVLSAEKSLPRDQQRLDEGILNKHLFWVQIKLLLPRGIVKEFSTEPIGFTETMDCTLSCVWSSLSDSDLAHSILNVTAWETTPQSDTFKLGESSFKWRSIQADGRPFWVTFDPSEDHGLSRRLSRASSHDPPYQRNYDAEQDLSGSSESFKDFAESIASAIPRSRSAETNILNKLDIPNNSEYGLSAPASLAPSRRNSSLLIEEERETKLQSYVRCSSFSTNDLFVGDEMKKALSASYETLPQVGDDYKKRTYLDPSDTNQERGFYNKPSRRSFSHHDSGRKLPNPGQDPLGHAEKSRGQVKLGVIAYHGQVDIEVIGARNLPPESNMEPDTFVQVTLYDSNGPLSNQKTRTMRQTCNPKFHQTLSFKCPKKTGLGLIVDVNAEDLRKHCSSESLRRKRTPSPKRGNFRNVGRVTIALDNLPLESLTISWYRLVPENVACL